MHLNHANLSTTDVAGLSNFFTGHFGFTLEDMRGRDSFAVLTGSDGFALNIMAAAHGEDAAYPRNFHIGFFLDEPGTVREKHDKLVRNGIETGQIQTLNRGGVVTTTFYCMAPGGILVEVAATGA